MPCYYPFNVRNDTYEGPVPCGICPACRKRRVMTWSFRLSWEMRRSTTCHFITLTYDNLSLPFTAGRRWATLYTRHFQLFCKSLRKAVSVRCDQRSLPTPSLRYLCAGEYGSINGRPHFHCILFNLPQDFLDLLAKTWKHGNVDISLKPVGGGAFYYAASYSLKGARFGRLKSDDRQPERIYFSKGLGLNYLAANGKYHLDGNIPYVTLDGGYRLPLPRLFRDKLFNTPELLDTYKTLGKFGDHEHANAQYYQYLSLVEHDFPDLDRFAQLRLAASRLAVSRRAYSREFFLQQRKSKKL